MLHLILHLHLVVFSLGVNVQQKIFLPVLTDYGLCYTFNSGKTNNTILRSYRTGTFEGFRNEILAACQSGKYTLMLK